MQRFARLLDQLYFTSGTKAKTQLLLNYLREAPDPDRGWAIAALSGDLRFDLFKRPLIKELITERVDPFLFDLSYDYVGELSETVAHLWPSPDANSRPEDQKLPPLHEIVEGFRESTRAQTRERLSHLLDIMTPNQRWALLKLGTRGLRIGISERFLKKVLAEFGGVPVEAVERVWHGVEAPYPELLAWLDGEGPEPDVSDQVVFHPVMLSHPLDDKALEEIEGESWQAEWKLDGIRVQWVSQDSGCALFSRTGEDISHSFPDLSEALHPNDAVLDGELLVMHEGEPGSFNELQQRLNKKKPARALMRRLPVGICIYDALRLGSDDLTGLPLSVRRQRLSEWFKGNVEDSVQGHRLTLSPLLTFDDAASLKALREQAPQAGPYIEGLMLKRKDSLYVPGRPKGQWYKWKRDPRLIDAVMMYAQRGHGKRSSYYSDYTFGLWQDDRLLPVGKAYSGFTDEELKKLDRWVRNNSMGRFGPVREVEKALVLEVAFDAVQSSSRHKSGLALRFPRINRIRWDKPADEADQLSTLAAMLPAET